LFSFLDRHESCPTPEFVAWALERACALRDIEGWTEPDRVERQLRPLRELSAARREGREREGVALAPDWCDRRAGDPPREPLGFFVQETLQAYGGEAWVASQCDGCPANALARSQPGLWAGCYGALYSEETDALHKAADVAAHDLGLEGALATEFLSTTPQWRGLWAASPLMDKRLSLVRKLLAHPAFVDVRVVGLSDAVTAIETALEQRLAFHANLTPAGVVRGRDWHIPSHCQRCNTPRPPGDPHCRACGLAGGVASQRRRKARGLRPYQPLARIMGSAAAERLTRECRDSPPTDPR
jgi:hypothetical protein